MITVEIVPPISAELLISLTLSILFHKLSSSISQVVLLRIK